MHVPMTQTSLSERALELLALPDDGVPRLLLDLGCGSGLVAIAAAKAGARSVLAADIDPHGVVATELNGVANGVAVIVVEADLTAGPPPDVDVILVGDLFYASELADRVTAFLLRCLAAGAAVIVGDPGRVWLPHQHLRRLAEYPTLDFGEAREHKGGTAAVYAFVAETAV